MGLVSMLTQSISADQYSDKDPDWYLFILDHRVYLKENSSAYTPSVDDMTQYQYDLDWFIRSLGITVNITWIVMLINDLTSIKFNDSMTIYIPSASLISTLYASYCTSKAAAITN